MEKTELLAAIAYFEDAIRESDEIIAGCSTEFQAEPTEQKRHFVVALEAMCSSSPDNKPLTVEKYSWSFNQDDDIWRNSADSIEDCIYQAKEDADDEDTVYIGENIAFAPSVDAEHVLDELREQAGDFAGELGYEWDAYDYKTMRKELDELSDGLTAVVLTWLKKHGREPNFYQVENIKPHLLFKPRRGGLTWRG